MSNAPAVITVSMLWQELQEVKNLLRSVAKEQIDNNIEEVSVNKASRLMRVGYAKVIEHIENRELKARSYTANGKIRYRIRVADIRAFQEQKAREADWMQHRREEQNNKPKTIEEVIAHAYAQAGIDPKKPKRKRSNLL